MAAQEPDPGQWNLVLNTADCELNTVHTAIHACVIFNPSNGNWKVLYFAATGSPYRSYIWNPANPGVTPPFQSIPIWPGGSLPRMLFCSGHSFLPDGRLLVAGGNRDAIIPPPPCPQFHQFRGIPYTYIFNPVTESWSVAGPQANPHAMDDGRYYPTITTLGDGDGYGKILAMSGLRTEISGCNQVVNRDPEIYDPDTGWSKMANPPQAVQPFDDLYPGAHVIPYGSKAGKVFYSMPMKQAWIFDPYFSGPPNGGNWTQMASEREKYREHGNSVLLPLLPGSSNAKVMIIGGGAPATNTAEIIDLASGSPSWSSVNPMTYARENSNAVILPDDKILVIGGNLFHPTEGAIFTAEAYDTETGTWKQLPPSIRRRMYHSVALLLPDGRVWVSGTQLGYVVERNIEIYSPGYLFEGSRPEFAQQPPDVIYYGTQFSFATDVPIDSIRLIRLGSTTHSIDMDQRSVGLSFMPGPLNHAYPVVASAPANANIAPPGYYMLFALRPKSASSSGQTRIPSVAKIIKVEREK